jgi:hypothetical protein
VGRAQLTHSFPIGGGQGFDGQGAVGDHVDESDLGCGSEVAIQQVTGVGNHQTSRDERAGVGFQKIDAGLVVWIGAVRYCDQRSGIND